MNEMNQLDTKEVLVIVQERKGLLKALENRRGRIFEHVVRVRQFSKKHYRKKGRQ